MGVSWIFEILTTFWHPSYIMFAVDLFNIFQGVYVFFIFAFKRTVFNAIKKRLGEQNQFSSFLIKYVEYLHKTLDLFVMVNFFVQG